MKILVDVGVGRLVEQWLADQGYNVLAVRTLDPRMPDSDILALAAAEDRLVITMDKDFGELVARAHQPHAGILLLRLEEADSQTKVKVVSEISLLMPNSWRIITASIIMTG
jgi:predicted nuclease of predicted toxin-antitoxin system